ncbi:hypothetical protein STVA_30680 [Allostella vacuolata]|nr:hypothetical protein STVA_30680 [Stella vacuolata]
MPSLLLRLLAATAGTYLLAMAWVTAFARAWPGPPADGVLLGTMTSFLAGMLAILWIFATGSAWRASAGLALLTAALWLIALLAGAP